MAQRKQKRKSNPERGLLARVARKAGCSLSMVSMVNSGRAVSERVAAALAREREAMRNGCPES
jgi:hypothetical protein